MLPGSKAGPVVTCRAHPNSASYSFHVALSCLTIIAGEPVFPEAQVSKWPMLEPSGLREADRRMWMDPCVRKPSFSTHHLMLFLF